MLFLFLALVFTCTKRTLLLLLLLMLVRCAKKCFKYGTTLPRLLYEVDFLLASKCELDDHQKCKSYRGRIAQFGVLELQNPCHSNTPLKQIRRPNTKPDTDTAGTRERHQRALRWQLGLDAQPLHILNPMKQSIFTGQRCRKQHLLARPPPQRTENHVPKCTALHSLTNRNIQIPDHHIISRHGKDKAHRRKTFSPFSEKITDQTKRLRASKRKIHMQFKRLHKPWVQMLHVNWFGKVKV